MTGHGGIHVDARDVLDVLVVLEEDGVDAVIHGGWGIDAVVGSQDRDHYDVDLLISQEHLSLAVASLSLVGFTVTEEVDVDGGPATVTMIDRSARRVDLTALRRDEDGDQWMGDGRSAVAFPSSAFTDGWVAGRQVRCVGAVKQVELHDGYPPRERDHHDMATLQAKFGILPPRQYR